MKPSLSELKTEENLLLRFMSESARVTPEMEERLAVVRKKIEALEQSYDHGGWEDS